MVHVGAVGYWSSNHGDNHVHVEAERHDSHEADAGWGDNREAADCGDHTHDDGRHDDYHGDGCHGDCHGARRRDGYYRGDCRYDGYHYLLARHLDDAIGERDWTMTTMDEYAPLPLLGHYRPLNWEESMACSHASVFW